MYFRWNYLQICERCIECKNPFQNSDIISSDVICPDDLFISVSYVGYSHNNFRLGRIHSQWYDESERIASFSEAVRKPVCSDMKLAWGENSNGVQDYSNEPEVDAYFPFDCFAGESFRVKYFAHLNA